MTYRVDIVGKNRRHAALGNAVPRAPGLRPRGPDARVSSPRDMTPLPTRRLWGQALPARGRAAL